MAGWLRLLLSMLLLGGSLRAQDVYDRRNSFTILAEYANDSSHIVAGAARERKLVTMGGAYTFRVAHLRGSEIGYRVELRPLVFESDPVEVIQTTFVTAAAGTQITSTTQAIAGLCRPSNTTVIEPFPPPTGNVTLTTNATCGRQWTFGEAFAPFGFQYTASVRHRVQPYVVGTLGYLYTSRPIPVANAEGFNFVVDAGLGVQIYRSGRRAVGLESRVRHISNRNTAAANPGIDSVTYGIAYSFGR